MPKSLTITLGERSGRVTADTLIEALENTLTILRSLDQETSATARPLEWQIIRASMASPLTITLAPETDHEEEPQ
jgi:hypothetical protein